MCGIISVKRIDGRSPLRMLLKQYADQKGRGQQGFGFIALKDGKLIEYSRSEGEEEIMAAVKKVHADEIIFHHRYPTSTPNVREAAHPIKVTNKSLKYDYYLIHNGIVWDSDEDKARHEAEGFIYTTEVKEALITRRRKVMEKASKWNDSECLAIELAKDIDRDGSGIELRGSIAFVMLAVDKRTKRAVKKYWGTNGGMPLKFGEVEGIYNIISSEGFGRDVPENKLFEFDYETKAMSCRDYRIGESYKQRAGFNVHSEPEPVSARDSEEYYELLEKYDQLNKQYNRAVDEGREDAAIQEALDEVEDKLSLMEREFDQVDLNKNLALGGWDNGTD